MSNTTIPQQGPVHDPVCEQGIMSILLCSANLYADAAQLISQKMFYDPKYAAIFKAIATIYGQGKTPDIISVAQWLLANEPYLGIDSATLLDITAVYHSSANIYTYCQRLRQLWQRRQLWLIGQRLLRAGTDEALSIDEVRHDTIEQLADIEKQEGTEVVRAKEVVDELRGVVDNNRAGKRRKGILTGFKPLDERGGLQRSDLVVVAAESSQGKTSLAVTLCQKAAFHDHPCAFYSTEMTNDQLMARILASQCGISSRVIMQEALTDSQLHAYELAEELTRPLPIFFDDSSTISIERIIISIRQLVLRHHVEVAFIDYLQVLQTAERARQQSEEQFFGTVARQLKNLAKELNICIVLLSQLSRDKTTTEPSLSRLRGSGQIAEAADMVLLIYRPVVYGKKYTGEFSRVRPEGTALIRMAKGRNVGTCAFICGYDAPTTHFFELGSIPTIDQPADTPTDNGRPF